VYIPYEKGNDPASGVGAWCGVAQQRGQSGFPSKEAATAYCEETIRDYAQATVNGASNFIDMAPVTVQVDPGAVDALSSYQQADMDGIMVLVSRQAIEECLPALRALAEQEGA
jgi:hypothetical protein